MMRTVTAAAFALATWAGAAAAQEEGGEIAEMAMGDPDAPVTVIEYASFTCPHCASFHDEGFERLKADYVDTGKVRYVYREVYFDRPGIWAGLVARCGGEDRYFGIVDLIYEKQGEWARGDEPAEIAENLRRIGRSAGLSEDELETCLQDGDKAQAMLADFQSNSEADGIESTPSFVIGGQTYTNRPYDDLAALIDEELGE